MHTTLTDIAPQYPLGCMSGEELLYTAARRSTEQFAHCNPPLFAHILGLRRSFTLDICWMMRQSSRCDVGKRRAPANIRPSLWGQGSRRPVDCLERLILSGVMTYATLLICTRKYVPHGGAPKSEEITCPNSDCQVPTCSVRVNPRQTKRLPFQDLNLFWLRSKLFFERRWCLRTRLLLEGVSGGSAFGELLCPCPPIARQFASVRPRDHLTRRIGRCLTCGPWFAAH
jgi:hypothetical protein